MVTDRRGRIIIIVIYRTGPIDGTGSNDGTELTKFRLSAA